MMSGRMTQIAAHLFVLAYFYTNFAPRVTLTLSGLSNKCYKKDMKLQLNNPNVDLYSLL